jgi:methionyl-tRNA formyltransferase
VIILAELLAKIVFMGSPRYAEIILQELYERFDIVGVITQPDKRVGRGRIIQSPPVKVFAKEKGIPFLQPEKLVNEEVLCVLSGWDPNIIVVAAYGKILRKQILKLPRFGCVNVHASYLPRWRGASPIQAAILNGDQTAGVTIMKMDEGIDTGDIIIQKEIEISESETAASLTEKLAAIGSKLLADTLPQYIGRDIVPKKQPSTNATYAGLINKQDGLLDFQKSAEELERQIRAYDPWPICYFSWNSRNVKVFNARVLKSHHLKPGQRGIIEKYPCIGTRTYDLQVVKLQMPGRQKISGIVFLNGARNWVDKNVEETKKIKNQRNKNEK